MGKKIEKDIIRKEFGKYGTICICAFIFALSINPVSYTHLTVIQATLISVCHKQLTGV